MRTLENLLRFKEVFIKNGYKVNILEETHVFEIDPTIIQLLQLTDNTIHETKLPYTSTFIDATFNMGEYLIQGILLVEPTSKLIEKEGRHRLMAFAVIQNELFWIFDLLKVPLCEPLYTKWDVPGSEELKEKFIARLKKISKSGCTYEEYCAEIEQQNSTFRNEIHQIQQRFDDKTAHALQILIMNFLDFIHDPEVEWREHKSVQFFEQQLRTQGFKKAPPSKCVVIHGKLKRYLTRLREHQISDFTYSHRFWVRGHWRHYYSPFYKNVRGLRTWVYPHIKGQGILIEKIYAVKK